MMVRREVAVKGRLVIWSCIAVILLIGVGAGTALGNHWHQVTAAVSPPGDVAGQNNPAGPSSAADVPTEVEEPTTPKNSSVSFPANADCYDLSILNETEAGRKAYREAREGVRAFMDEKLQDSFHVVATLSGSDRQELNFGAAVRWPEDEELVARMAGSLRKHMIDSRSGDNFCNPAFARVRFIAVDDVRQSIHVLWALRITKDSYKNITTEEQAKLNVEGREQ